MDEQPGGFIDTTINGIVSAGSAVFNGIGDFIGGLANIVRNAGSSIADIAAVPGDVARNVSGVTNLIPIVLIAVVGVILYVFIFRPGNIATVAGAVR